MEKFSGKISSSDMLRQAAQKKLFLNNRAFEEKTDIDKVVYELQLHQVELEMQNEELQRSAYEAQLFSSKYFDLFDYAPVGLLTSDKAGIIKNANFSLSQLLGEEKRNLINKRIQTFLHFSYTDSFFYFTKHVISSSTKQILELQLVRKDGSTVPVLLESVVLPKAEFGPHEILTAVVDISPVKSNA